MNTIYGFMTTIVTFRTKKSVLISLIWSIFIALALWFSFCAYIHWSFQGKYWESFLPGSVFGIPSKLYDRGIRPVTEVGWDGQFYYSQSNDPFIQNDTPQNIDAPAYRYQRIGIPLLAYAVAKICGYSFTPAIVYHAVQFFIVFLGLFFLTKYLLDSNLNPILSIGWILSLGVMNALSHGMPDPAGDALLVMALLALLNRRLIWYAGVTTLLLLVREGYVVIAAMVFALTSFGQIQWSKKKVVALVFTALPGIIWLAWIIFITAKLGGTPARAGSGSGLIDWPFAGFLKEYFHPAPNRLDFEQNAKLLSIFFILATIFLILKTFSQDKILALTTAPYVLLTVCLGTTVWFDFSGHMKAIGSIIIIFYFLNSKTKYRFLYLSCIVMGVFGLKNIYYLKVNQSFAELDPITKTNDITAKQNIPLKNFSAEVVSWNIPRIINRPPADGMFSRFHREPIGFNVTVKNTSDNPWKLALPGGNFGISLSYKWLSLDKLNLVLEGTRAPVSDIIRPGETANFPLRVYLPAPGEYILRISMIQDGVAWFYAHNSGYRDLPITVK